MAILKPGLLIGALCGSGGNTTFIRTRNGVQVRDRVTPSNPRTPAQEAARNRLRQAGAAWLSLTVEEAQAWRDYATSLQTVDLDTGSTVGPLPQSLFSKLAVKFLQASPGGEIPRLPPDSPFIGDGIALSGVGIAGAIAFTASGPNSEGILTELLLQPLASIHRAAYRDKYRSQAFVAFASDSHTIPVSPGIYATAYRFVRAATGQDSSMIEAGRVVVS